MSIRLQQDIKNLQLELDRQILANNEKENKVNLFKLSISNKTEENKVLQVELEKLQLDFDKLNGDYLEIKNKPEKIIYEKLPIEIDTTEFDILQKKYEDLLIENAGYIKTNETLISQNNQLRELQLKDENQIAFQIEQNIVLNNENKKTRENFNTNLNTYKNKIELLQNQIDILNNKNIICNNEIQELTDRLVVTTKLAQLYTDYIEDQERELKNKKQMDKLVNRSIRKK